MSKKPLNVATVKYWMNKQSVPKDQAILDRYIALAYQSVREKNLTPTDIFIRPDEGSKDPERPCSTFFYKTLENQTGSWDTLFVYPKEYASLRGLDNPILTCIKYVHSDNALFNTIMQYTLKEHDEVGPSEDAVQVKEDVVYDYQDVEIYMRQNAIPREAGETVNQAMLSLEGAHCIGLFPTEIFFRSPLHMSTSSANQIKINMEYGPHFTIAFKAVGMPVGQHGVMHAHPQAKDSGKEDWVKPASGLQLDKKKRTDGTDYWPEDGKLKLVAKIPYTLLAEYGFKEGGTPQWDKIKKVIEESVKELRVKKP